MRTHAAEQVGAGETVGDGHGKLADEVAGAAADHVNSQEFLIRGGKDELDKASIHAFDDGFGVSGHEVFPDFDLDALLLGLFFAEAHGGDFRLGVNAGGNDVGAGLHRLSGDVSDRGLAFGFGFVGELHAADEIADGVDAGQGGFKVFVDLDEFAIHLELNAFAQKSFEIRFTAFGDEYGVGDGFALTAFGVELEVQAVGLPGDGIHRSIQRDFDAAALKDAVELHGQVFIHFAENARRGDDEFDLSADIVVEGGKFTADDAPAQDGDAPDLGRNTFEDIIAADHSGEIKTGGSWNIRL